MCILIRSLQCVAVKLEPTGFLVEVRVVKFAARWMLTINKEHYCSLYFLHPLQPPAHVGRIAWNYFCQWQRKNWIFLSTLNLMSLHVSRNS
jgi:hypothetical protein